MGKNLQNLYSYKPGLPTVFSFLPSDKQSNRSKSKSEIEVARNQRVSYC